MVVFLLLQKSAKPRRSVNPLRGFFLTRRHEGAKTQRFLFRAKLAKEQGRKEFEKEDAKARFFFKNKVINKWKILPTF